MMSIFAICGHLKTLTQTNLNFIFLLSRAIRKEKKTHNKPASAYLRSLGLFRKPTEILGPAVALGTRTSPALNPPHICN